MVIIFICALSGAPTVTGSWFCAQILFYLSCSYSLRGERTIGSFRGKVSLHLPCEGLCAIDVTICAATGGADRG